MEPRRRAQGGDLTGAGSCVIDRRDAKRAPRREALEKPWTFGVSHELRRGGRAPTTSRAPTGVSARARRIFPRRALRNLARATRDREEGAKEGCFRLQALPLFSAAYRLVAHCLEPLSAEKLANRLHSASVTAVRAAR